MPKKAGELSYASYHRRVLDAPQDEHEAEYIEAKRGNIPDAQLVEDIKQFRQIRRADRQSAAHEAFDPEGEGYDYETAKQAGIEPDETGHWPSREPNTGVILKGRKHPTFDKTIAADEKMGYTMVKGEDGRYYSQPRGEPEQAPTKNPMQEALDEGYSHEEIRAYLQQKMGEGRGLIQQPAVPNQP